MIPNTFLLFLFFIQIKSTSKIIQSVISPECTSQGLLITMAHFEPYTVYFDDLFTISTFVYIEYDTDAVIPAFNTFSFIQVPFASDYVSFQFHRTDATKIGTVILNGIDLGKVNNFGINKDGRSKIGFWMTFSYYLKSDFGNGN